MFLVHENLYKQMNNEIIGKRGNYFKTIKQHIYMYKEDFAFNNL